MCSNIEERERESGLFVVFFFSFILEREREEKIKKEPNFKISGFFQRFR